MREILPVFVVLAILLCITAAVASVVLYLMPDRKVTAVLIYEIDPQAQGDPALIDMQAVKEVVERRVNPGYRANADISLLSDGRIKVGLFDDDPDTIERTQLLLETVGKLDFYVLASRSEHADLIKKAEQQPTRDEFQSPGGDLLAKWLPVRPGRGSVFPANPENLRRGDTQNVEFLVIANGFDAVNEHLRDAWHQDEGHGQFAVEIQLTPEGIKRFKELMSEDAPGGVFFRREYPRRLAVVLDGHLCTVIDIEYPRYNRVRITGLPSQLDVEALAAALKSGPLPAPLRFVEVRQNPTRQ